MSSGSDVDQISITWNQPSVPNGIIYTELTSYVLHGIQTN